MKDERESIPPFLARGRRDELPCRGIFVARCNGGGRIRRRGPPLAGRARLAPARKSSYHVAGLSSGTSERRGWGVSLRCAPGRASRAVGNETTVANGAEPPARQVSLGI